MTAKRFTVPKQYRCIQDNQTEEKYLCEDKSEAIALANLLNALHEENQQVKDILNELKSIDGFWDSAVLLGVICLIGRAVGVDMND